MMIKFNNIKSGNYHKVNNIATFGCFGKRNKPTNDSVDFKNNNKTENQNKKNWVAIIDEKMAKLPKLPKFFNKEVASSVDDTVKKDEIEKMQKEVKNINSKDYKKYSENEKTIRTATVQKTANVKKTTGEKKNDYSNLPNPPQFSFDFDKLMSDLSKIEGTVDEKWVTENPDSAFNLIKAAAKGEQVSKKAWEFLAPTDTSKVNFINNLIGEREKFIEEVTNQYKMAFA